MNGAGLDLIYNEQTERLEYFEIKDLDSLHIKGSQAVLFSADNAKTQEPNEPHIVSDAPTTEAKIPDTQPQARQEEGVYYKCTFRKNVLVNTPDELIFAGNKLCISDIFWSKSSSEQPAEDDAEDANDVETVAETTEPGQQADDSVSERRVTAPVPAEPNVPSEQLQTIVLTCEDGFVVVPRDSLRAQEDDAENETQNTFSAIHPPDEFDDRTGKTRFLAQRIDYNAATEDGIVDGPSEITFYVEPTSGTDPNKKPVPVKVSARKRASFSIASNKVVFEGDCLVTMPQSGLTQPKDVTFSAPEITVNLPEDKYKKPDMNTAGPAELVFYMPDPNSTNMNREPPPVTVNAQKNVRFLAASNQIVFEGDSRCTMLQEDPNTLTKYILLSEKITVDLPEDMNELSPDTATGIKHLTATGDVVRLAMTKTAKDKGQFTGQVRDANSAKLLSGVELKCSRFDYDAVLEKFVAKGPGDITLNNTEAPEPNEPAGRFSMRKPCWAFIDRFDTLTYFVRENRIVADSGSQGKLQMDYIPTIDDGDDEHVSAKASGVEVILFKGPEGLTQLATLRATGGIEYRDKDNQFIGSELFYDHETGIVKVKGDESQPCYHNGILVEGIEMNEKTGEVEAKIVGPGTIQINR
jgi:hypothetical protein